MGEVFGGEHGRGEFADRERNGEGKVTVAVNLEGESKRDLGVSRGVYFSLFT